MNTAPIRIAAIGAAHRPQSNIEGLIKAGASIVGLCDVDTRFTEPVRNLAPNAPFFRDWREMLNKFEGQIDAVTIGTPDHWHAEMAIECLRRGLHVQCEKPLSSSFDQIDRMVAAAKASGKVNQAMNQGHAYDSIRDFREWIEAGLIGEVSEIHCWATANYSQVTRLGELAVEEAPPPELDWELWQGPALPHVPYHKLYLPGVWRFWTKWGCGTLGDWSCHVLDPVFWTFEPGLPVAVTAEPVGDWNPETQGCTFPPGARTTFEFAPASSGRPLKLVWYDGIAKSLIPTPPGYPSDEILEPLKPRANGYMPEGAFVYGSEGVIQYGSHGALHTRILPNLDKGALRAAGRLPAERYARVPDGSPYVEFLQAIRNGTRVGSDFEYAGAMTKTALLAIAALFEPGRRLEFDAAAQSFRDAPKANAFLHRK